MQGAAPAGGDALHPHRCAHALAHEHRAPELQRLLEIHGARLQQAGPNTLSLHDIGPTHCTFMC
jgi:hypothetical protein